MKKSVLFLVLAIAGCTALQGEEPKIVSLTSSERAAAQAIAMRRDAVQQKRNEAQLAFNTQMNRLNEEAQQIDMDVFKMCLQLKKSHELSNTVNYRLEEWKGELVRQ